MPVSGSVSDQWNAACVGGSQSVRGSQHGTPGGSARDRREPAGPGPREPPLVRAAWWLAR